MPSYRIKSWEELLATPGVVITNNGDLSGPHDSFVRNMKHLCGKNIKTAFEITKERYSYEENGGWSIYHWMIVDKQENFKNLYEKLLSE